MVKRSTTQINVEIDNQIEDGVTQVTNSITLKVTCIEYAKIEDLGKYLPVERNGVVENMSV
jgi:hypothetical protein